ncbi:MAG: GNAT family N-acetyltransferase [Anaerolineales bacterium]
MEFQVERLTASNLSDFMRFHTRVGGECFCTAWWVPTWDEWRRRSADDNRSLRDELLHQGEFDGYLLYAGANVVGWCQVGRRDRLSKLVAQFDLHPEPDVRAVTCFQIDPAIRKRGLASELLHGVLADLRARGVKRVQAFAKLDAALPAESQWTGPRGLYERAGFTKLRDNKTRTVYEIGLEAFSHA